MSLAYRYIWCAARLTGVFRALFPHKILKNKHKYFVQPEYLLGYKVKIGANVFKFANKILISAQKMLNAREL